MNSPKNARTTFAGRILLIERIATMGLKPAAESAGISVRTARKWLRRFKQGGQDGLFDRSSRPQTTRSTVDDALCQRIEQLRRARMPMRAIAAIVGTQRGDHQPGTGPSGPFQLQVARNGFTDAAL